MPTNVNLGRIKGAGFFTSTASSSTSVAISTIAPTNITPLVGDSIVFPNGDVRRVTVKSSTMITCGAVVANIKGAKGDNGGGSNENLLINSNFAINQRDGYFAPVGATVYADDLTTVLGTVRTAIQTNLYNATWRVATSIEATLNGSNITISTGYIQKSDCESGYIAAASGWTYTVDRWRIAGSGSSYNVATNTVTLANNALDQIIELPTYLKGKTVTASINVSSISGSFTFRTYDGTTTTTQTLANGTVSKTITIGNSATSLRVLVFGTGSFVPNWVKLEVGSVATEYTPPLIAEELPKCQRYYQRFTSGGTYHAFASGWVRTDTTSQNLRFIVQYRTSMRTRPSFEYHGNFGFTSVGETKVVSTITFDGSSSNNSATLIATSTSAATAGQGGALVSNNDTTAYIAFDAEL